MTKRKDPKGRNGAFRSKLTPYEAQLRQWLRAGKTYAEMAELFQKEHGLAVTKSTINSFVLVRSKGKRRAMLPPPLAEAQETPPEAPAGPGPAKGRGAAPAASGAQKWPKTHGPGMLPPQSSKYHDSSGYPVKPPQDPRAFRSENL